MSDRAKDTEILALRHQITVREPQLGAGKVTFAPEDRALLAVLRSPLPRSLLCRLRNPTNGWGQPAKKVEHRDLMRQRHANASRPQRPGRPRTVRSIRQLVPRHVRSSPPCWQRNAGSRP